ncbi:MAG: DUF1801 domain-containing protein [Candidatus Melainabacteria bacterium]|nr:DUF1801 domain-containing protein [Candidatus Melainabacteria bacterium]
MSSDFEKILDQFDPSMKEIATEIEKLIYQVYPKTVEVAWVQQKVIGYGTGPKKMTEHFCWIQPNKKHVNLGFNYGAELPDKDNLLEGTGKLFRHIKMKSVADVQRPGVRELLKVACRHRVQPSKS